MNANMYLFIGYAAYLALASLCTFALFLKDKSIALKHNNDNLRIKERTLLGACVFGGAVGGFFGRIVAHHKTNKKYFSFTIYVSLLMQIAAFAVLLVLAVLK